MDPLSVTASIISTLQLSAKVLGYLNEVKDASKDRAQCAIEASNLYNLLFNLRVRVEEGDPAKPWYSALRALAVENGPLDQFKQALGTLQTGMTQGGRLKKAGEALVWKFKKEEVTSILYRMERLKTIVEIALQMDHFKLSQIIKDDTSFVRTHVHDVEQHRLLEWISPTDYPAQQSDIIKRRQEGTGQWFLDAPEVARWLSEAKGTLFCPGIPGAGKTMVAAIAIDHLLKSVQNGPVGVAYVYCNYKAQEEQDPSNMLAAILKQLAQAQPSIAEPIQQLHKQHANQGTRPSLDDIFNTLQTILTHYSTVYIVSDALDECRDGTRRQFLARLRDLQADGDVRLMATSRFIPEIENTFREAPRLEVQASEEDVKRFVIGQLYRLPRCIQRDTALQDIVQDRIAEAVDGMFLLARLYTDSLLDKRTVKDVKTTLARLSKGSTALDNAYRDAVQRIEGQLGGDYELAKKVLSWIIFAKRPLTTAEICCALAIEPDESELDPENIPDIEDLVSVCAGLVIIDSKSSIIRLVHYTTQEYFERIRDVWNPNAQLYITTTCLTYLSLSVFRSGRCLTREEFERRLHQNVFLEYAAKYWGEHATTTEGEVYELARTFLFNSNLVQCAAQALSVLSFTYGSYGHDSKSTTGLHFVAQFGLFVISEAIIPSRIQERAIVLETRDGSGRTPLYLAAKHGHYKMVKLLVDKGANVNAQLERYGNALYVASCRGYEQIVVLLLDKGASINAQGGYYGNALQAASEEGNDRIVRLLVDRGADVNAQGKEYGSNNSNALYAASYRGHEQIVKLLVDKGANVNAQGGYYGNALQLASYNGYERVVRLLIDQGADVNSQGGYYGNALYAASSEGYEQIVGLLLEKGANVNAQSGYYGNDNALYAASFEGYEQIVRLLVDKGADVNAESGDYGNALQAASAGGHEQIVRLLLDKGADVDAQGGHYGNILQAASVEGHEQIVKLLVDKGAEVNARGRFYSNALHAALEGRHEQVAMLLVDKGADVNTKGGYYGNALQAASAGGYEQLVQLLLDKGANVNAQGGYYGNALQAASVGGYEQIVKLLVDKGANVNAQNGGDYDNALCAASYRGYEQIARLLVDKGADVNAPSGYYDNSLQAASIGGHEQIVLLLLDKGADVNTQGGEYGNALQAASKEGHEHIVQLLLDKGADVNAQGGYYGNALQAALEGGYEQIVKLLVDGGADLNAQGGEYGNSNALYAASYRRYEQIVRLLVDKGADVNGQDGGYGRPLYAASFGGDEQIVALLLDEGANINAQGGYYGNALQAASKRGHEHIVLLLLDKGADVNAQGGHYGNALQAASVGGYEQIVKLLVDKGADVNAQGGFYGNALQAASVGGYEQISKLLVDNGADVNAQGGYYGYALQAAVVGGHERPLKLLLSKGVALQLQTPHGETAMSLAAFHGHLSILKLLITLPGVSSHSTDLHGRTLLWWAAAGGQTATVEFLIERCNLDPQIVDRYGRTPLWIAAKKGHGAVLKVLNKEYGEGDWVAMGTVSNTHTDNQQMTCDVCTSDINVDVSHYHCRNCANGDWDICEDCKMRGASCAEGTHILVRRVMRDGVWAEETS